MYRERGKAKWSISLPMSEKLKWVSLGFLLHRCGERENPLLLSKKKTPNLESEKKKSIDGKYIYLKREKKRRRKEQIRRYKMKQA